MADKKRKALLFYLFQRRRREQIMYQNIILYAITKRNMILHICILFVFLILSLKTRNCTRSCRRLERNPGWFNLVWTNYSDRRFKMTFRMSRETFRFKLQHVRHKLLRDTIIEEPITPECRLAIGLYRLSRGDYFFTISEMVGLGVSTVCTITKEVTIAIVENMWEQSVNRHMAEKRRGIQEKNT